MSYFHSEHHWRWNALPRCQVLGWHHEVTQSGTTPTVVTRVASMWSERRTWAARVTPSILSLAPNWIALGVDQRGAGWQASMDLAVGPEFESWLSIKRAQDLESELGAFKPYAHVERLGLAMEPLLVCRTWSVRIPLRIAVRLGDGACSVPSTRSVCNERSFRPCQASCLMLPTCS